MSLTAKVTPSYTWPDASKVTLARLRLTARPTVEILGAASTAQIADGAVTVAKLEASLQARFVNVKDAPYGAVGDGVTNDTPSIMLAIAALKALGGGVLRIPKGVYKLNKTVNGYAIGQYEVGTNYALYVDFSNIIIEGDGMGLTVLQAGTLSTTLLFVNGAGLKNIGLRGLTFENFDGTADWDGCATTLSQTGQNPALATSQIDQGYTLGTMIYFAGTADSFMSNVFAIECELKNPIRYGIGLSWVRCGRFSNINIRYYDGYGPAQFTQPAIAGRVGIYSGSQHVQDITVTGCNFNGNVNGNPYIIYNGFPLGSVYGSYMAADGFVWFSTGGNVTVSGNTIRNYSLEATQFIAAPAVCSNNNFFTVTPTLGAVACMMWPNSNNDVDIDKRLYVFEGNTVFGGAGGCWTKGAAFNNALPCPRHKTVANNNVLENVTYAFSAVAADTFECCNNVATGCQVFFIYDSTNLNVLYPAIDFRCSFLTFVGNTILGCTDSAFLVNQAMKDNGAISIVGGVISATNYHLTLANPSVGEHYNVLMADSVFLDSTGAECAPLMSTLVSANIRLVRHFGRPFYAAASPRTPALGYRKGDVLRNTARSKGGVLFWEAIGDGVGGATFEPVFSACRGVFAQGRIYALTAATPVELLPQLEGQGVRILALSVINAKACTWAGAGTTLLRIRTKPVTGSPVTLADIPISKLITATTLVAQVDITFVQPTDDVGGFGGSNVVGAGIEVIGWDTAAGGSAVNLTTNAGNTDGPVIIAAHCVYEYSASV